MYVGGISIFLPLAKVVSSSLLDVANTFHFDHRVIITINILLLYVMEGLGVTISYKVVYL
jgi:hypothetical protein